MAKKLIIIVGLTLGIALVSKAATYNYKITVISPTGVETWQVGTKQIIDWQVDSNNPGFVGYGLDLLLDKYPEHCVSSLPCPIVIKSNITTRNSPYTWTVGKDSAGRNIPAGQYYLKIVSSYDVSGSGSAEGKSQAPFTIVSSGPINNGASSGITGGSTTPTPKTTISSIFCSDNSTVNSDLPASLNLESGKTYNFSATVNNTGTTKWYDGAYYQFKDSSGSNLLNPAYGHLPYVVSAGSNAKWDFIITAPNSAGIYNLNMQMVHLAGGIYEINSGLKCKSATASDTKFGQTLASVITVTASSQSPTPSPSVYVPPTSGGGFVDWISSHWLMLAIILAIIILLIVAYFLSKSRGSTGGDIMPPPMPPIPPSSPSSMSPPPPPIPPAN